MSESTAAISENISKTRPGRPKSPQTSLLSRGTLGQIEGCHKTKVNYVFQLELLHLVMSAGEDIQRIVWGCSDADIMAGHGRFPKGWVTHSPEIGRYLIDATDEERQSILNVVVNARQRGIGWSDIAAHYRKLRLGEKTGNEDALTNALLRVVDQFRKQFPKTSRQVYVDALFRVRAEVSGFEDEAND